MDGCKLTGAGGIKRCAGVIRTTGLSIDGVIRRLEVCGLHHEWLGQITTPLVQDPLERLSRESQQTSPEAASARRGRRPTSREIALTCLVGTTEFEWAEVREKLREWGRPVPLSGPIAVKEVEFFRRRVLEQGLKGSQI